MRLSKVWSRLGCPRFEGPYYSEVFGLGPEDYFENLPYIIGIKGWRGAMKGCLD